MKLDDIFVVVSFGRLVLSSVFEFRSFNFIYHLRWAYVQILLRDDASTVPVVSAVASMLPKLTAASTPVYLSLRFGFIANDL